MQLRGVDVLFPIVDEQAVLRGIDRAEPSELRVRSDNQLLTDRWHLDVLYAPNPPPISHRAPRRRISTPTDIVVINPRL